MHTCTIVDAVVSMHYQSYLKTYVVYFLNLTPHCCYRGCGIDVDRFMTSLQAKFQGEQFHHFRISSKQMKRRQSIEKCQIFRIFTYFVLKFVLFFG